MDLVAVVSARKTAGDLLDLIVTVETEQGQENLPYGYRKGETFGIGPQVDDWFKAHKSFPIEPYEAPPAELPDLQPYQFRAMLKLSGKQDQLYAFIEALPDPQKTIAQSKLEYSLVFKRDNDLVKAAEQALGFTDAELDALWLQASTIL